MELVQDFQKGLMVLVERGVAHAHLIGPFDQ
jgi:hypothetical protein